jgi:endonuclease/exonuclease/phosphatase family metal-dependent hydrolase
MTGDHVVERVGLVVRRGLAYDVNPDDTALTLPGPPPAHLRRGADIMVRLAGGLSRVLAVHLKTGCQNDKLTSSRRPACKTRAEQLPQLQAWIGARKAEGAAFIVLGDFNRWMDDKDQVIAALGEAAPLVRVTEGRSSPCWGGERFVDHILAGGAAAQWMAPATLSVQEFREAGEDWKDRLSDHCAVAVHFRPPG